MTTGVLTSMNAHTFTESVSVQWKGFKLPWVRARCVRLIKTCFLLAGVKSLCDRFVRTCAHLKEVHVFFCLLQWEQRLMLKSTAHPSGEQRYLPQIALKTTPLLQSLLKSWSHGFHLEVTTREDRRMFADAASLKLGRISFIFLRTKFSTFLLRCFNIKPVWILVLHLLCIHNQLALSKVWGLHLSQKSRLGVSLCIWFRDLYILSFSEGYFFKYFRWDICIFLAVFIQHFYSLWNLVAQYFFF